MSWVAVGMAAIGVVKGKQNEKRQKKLDKGRQAAIRYSWASGLKDPGIQSAGPGAIDSGIQGAMAGAMINQSMGNSAQAANTAAPSSSSGDLLGVNYNTGKWDSMASNINTPQMGAQQTQLATSPTIGGSQPSSLGRFDLDPRFSGGGYGS